MFIPVTKRGPFSSQWALIGWVTSCKRLNAERRLFSLHLFSNKLLCESQRITFGQSKMTETLSGCHTMVCVISDSEQASAAVLYA